MHLLLTTLTTLLSAIPILSTPLDPSTAQRLTQHFTNDGPYHPRCRTATRPPPDPLPGLQPSACQNLIALACDMVSGHTAQVMWRNRWTWVTLPGCTLGYFLPPQADLPDIVECQFLIFRPLVDQCAYDSRFNAGGINVGELPNFENSGTAAVDEGGIRYIMAPAPLTRSRESVVAQVKTES